MALRIYFTGHRSFCNHGCEALVRSAVSLYRQALGAAEFLVPSADPAEDTRFWPDATDHGVRFVPVVDPWPGHRWWERAVRRVPGWGRLPWPPGPLAPGTRAALDEADLLISTGGDNYSLDYGLVSLFTMIGTDGAAMDRGVPAVLWGASVGPFDAAPHVLSAVRRHLARFDALVVRETATLDYLKAQGLDARLSLATDPAFLMTPEETSLMPFWPRETGQGTVALNISPIILRRHAGAGGRNLEDEMVAFALDLASRGYGVLFVPHVVGQSGSGLKCDHALMARLLERTGTAGGRIALLPRRFNAPQIKHALARCRFVIGARTHCTIGALSSGVPTLSIAYSVKATGINRDLFGDERYVLDGASLSRTSLDAGLTRLVADEGVIRATLAARKPDWSASLERAVATVRAAVEARGGAPFGQRYPLRAAAGPSGIACD
ncbi:polysaccharide pyruvyl transferase family protein [Azospirillum sp. RWY-5-1]|uniref:Polysaccharide pyruvyl transferase family protein n=1 Tax=Azospirillum oleiclasticum TaxID=2735135 RepID=A0ABX2TKP0_9PROT|nr:polysaccharide pyruvyl transferase family protein [Azospirillum oleiclasticum]NYZ16383.1 polysaccharide pyruvyl transferase family protein [Azospirillum oleiclasticum]NYZ23901.1 polysaccharide pyruvyl transferase family protein [Azospirillum oleiclasticum]